MLCTLLTVFAGLIQFCTICWRTNRVKLWGEMTQDFKVSTKQTGHTQNAF